MSLPILSTKPYLPALHPITPTIAPSSRTEGLISARKRPLEVISDVPDYTWTAPFRDGLPTPPNDMNGVTTCSALSSSSYGGKLDGFQLPPYSKVSDYTRMPSDVPNGVVSSSQPQYQAPAKDTVTSERESQKKSGSNGVASYLQVPSSISNRKGSLAEFAAQVSWITSISPGFKDADWAVDDVPFLVRKYSETEGRGGSCQVGHTARSRSNPRCCLSKMGDKHPVNYAS